MNLVPKIRFLFIIPHVFQVGVAEMDKHLLKNTGETGPEKIFNRRFCHLVLGKAIMTILEIITMSGVWIF